MSGQNGKGDKPRPFSVKREKFHGNWEETFGEGMILHNLEYFEGPDDGPAPLLYSPVVYSPATSSGDS